MSASIKIPVVILNGFLGSGKTTLFQKLLSQAQKKGIAVRAIVNDMSELDVDGTLIREAEIVEQDESILESIHSYVLSSPKGIELLDQAITRLLSHRDPELIIIETSGSCHPLPLVEYFKQRTETTLVGVFACVDSLMLAHDYRYAQDLIPRMQQNVAQGRRDTVNLLVEQIMFCSHVVFTKVDRIEEEKFSRLVSNVQSINPYVPAYRVLFGSFAIETILQLPEYDYFQGGTAHRGVAACVGSRGTARSTL